LEKCAASIFIVEVYGEWKADIEMDRVLGRVGAKWVTVQTNRKCGREVP